MNIEIINKLKNITLEEQEILEGKSQIKKELYMEPFTNVVDNKRLLENGKLIEVRPHTRFVHFPIHTHNYVEVIYMCEGCTHHIINGDSVELRKGELLFLNQNAKQEILPAEYDDIAVNFIILPEFFDQALLMIGEEENLLRDFIIGCLRNDRNQVNYLHFKVAEILPVQNLVENLIWTIMNNQQNNRSINQVTMGLLFLQLMNYTDKVTISKDNYEQDLMITVLRYIEEHYKEGKLTDLAEKLHYELYWLSKMIKNFTGQTYTELVQRKRLNQAAYLLTGTKLTIAEIGIAVGYDNLSYFHRIFRNKFGVSPRQYRACK